MKYIEYNKVALALASFCILFSTSCSDEFLDRIPTNNYTADTYYTSDEAIIKTVNKKAAWSVVIFICLCVLIYLMFRLLFWLGEQVISFF